MILPEVLPTKAQTEAFEIYQTRRIFEHYVCLQKQASAVQEMQRALDEQYATHAKRRIEEELRAAIEDEIRTQQEMPGIWHPSLEAKRQLRPAVLE